MFFIRKMEERDRAEVAEMMSRFYASDAVWTSGSPKIFQKDIDACLENSPYLEGYVLEEGNEVIGYGMLAKSFSTEFGKPCVWIEDIYLQENHRNKGFGSQFLQFVTEQYKGCLLRLEVEKENEHAYNAYVKNGFTVLPYTEMKKE